jgi:uncharacterized protein YndB with AHSA1/START domain
LPKLFVDKSIEIGATASRVWDVLTLERNTEEWASEFAVDGPPLRLISDWTLGSSVVWTDPKGRAVVEGIVTAVEQPRQLRFTVFAAGTDQASVTSENAISYTLTERSGRTTLWVSHGDFSSARDAERYHHLTNQIWDRALPKIRSLAESPRAPG